MNEQSRPLRAWVATLFWFLAGIPATGAFWHYLGQKSLLGVLLSGLATVLLAVIAAILQDRCAKAELLSLAKETGNRSPGLLTTTGVAVSAGDMPTLIVLGIQWVLAVFILDCYSRATGMFLGFLAPVWIIPLSYVVVRYVPGRQMAARVIGGILGAVVGAVVALCIVPSELLRGIGLGAYFVAVLSAYLIKRNNYIHAIWALFGTVTLFGLLGVFQYGDFIVRYAPPDAYILSAMATGMGIFVFEGSRLSNTPNSSLPEAWSPKGSPLKIVTLLAVVAAWMGVLVGIRASLNSIGPKQGQAPVEVADEKPTNAKRDTAIPSGCEPFVVDLKAGTVGGLTANASATEILTHKFCTNGHYGYKEERKISGPEIEYPKVGVTFRVSHRIDLQYYPPTPIQLKPEVPDRDLTDTMKLWGKPFLYAVSGLSPELFYETPTGCLEMQYGSNGDLSSIHLHATGCNTAAAQYLKPKDGNLSK